MIPCKDCLVLAACRNKKKIKCSGLFQWLQASHQNDKTKCRRALKFLFNSNSKKGRLVFRVSLPLNVLYFLRNNEYIRQGQILKDELNDDFTGPNGSQPNSNRWTIVKNEW